MRVAWFKQRDKLYAGWIGKHGVSIPNNIDKTF